MNVQQLLLNSPPAGPVRAEPERLRIHSSDHLSSATLEPAGPFGRSSTIALVLVLLASAVLVTIYHNRFWAPADEGNYAHIAERLLSGEVLHRDIQDVHAGYVNFVNAAAFSLFGLRLVSLRYPIAILTVLQSGLIFLLLRPRGTVSASVGALAATSLGFVQFLNPTANWYCLFLAVATIGWLRWVPRGVPSRDIGTGLLIGMTLLFRQLSGVLLGMGVLVFLLLEWPHSSKQDRGLARAVVLVVAGGLAAYLAQATDALGWLLFGIWPFPILVYAWRITGAPNRELKATLLHLALGAAVAAVPLTAYHLVHGSITPFVADTVGAALSLPGLDFAKRPGYLMMSVLAVRGLLFGDVAGRLNGTFWLTSLLLTALLGLTLLRALLRRSAASSLNPLPVVALFYALISVHYQIPIYLFYTLGLSLTAVLWLVTRPGNASRNPSLLGATILAVIALYYQAAMPLSRGLEGIVAGVRRPVATPLELERAGLYVEAEDAVRYSRLIQMIEMQTRPGDTILALPVNAELYFLSGRANAFRFYNSALGIQSAADLNSAIGVLECHPPKVVFYNPKDKYNTSASVRLAQYVRATYDSLSPLPPFEVFRRRNRQSGIADEHESCTARKGD